MTDIRMGGTSVWTSTLGIKFADGTTQTTAATSSSGNLSGLLVNMPALATGQLYFATDVQQAYIGTVSGNVLVESAGNATEIQGIPVDGTAPSHNGAILIFDSVQNKYIPGDPLVQGLFPELTATSGINPILVAGKGVDGKQHDVSTDNSGNLNVNVVNTPAVTLASTTITGSVAVTGTFWQATQPVSLASTTITGTVAVTQSTSPWVVSLASTTITGSVAVTGTFWQATQPISGAISFTAPQHVIVDSASLGTVAVSGVFFQTTQPVSLTSTTITGTVAVTGTFFQATQPVSLASTTITGSVAVTGTFWQATQPVSGTFWQATQPISGAISFTVPQHVIIDSATLGTVTVSGTVTANQGTSPWVVSLASTTITGSVAVTGTFWQATQPVSLTSTTITGTVAVTQSTSPWVVSGTVTTTPPANASTNLTQLNSVALGSPSNYGTPPGAVEVLGVNAFITNTPAVTLASTTITGTVAVTGTFWQATQPVSGTVTANQGTSPWVVSLTSTTITGSVAVTGTFWQATQPVSIAGTVAVSLASTTITGTVAVTQSTSPWVVSGTVTTTPPANASTNVTQWASVALGAPSAYGTTPGAVNVMGVNAFITNTPAVTLASTTITGSVAVTGTFWQATQPVSGTVTANQGTSPWVVSLTSTTITGTVAVTQSTSPWVVSLTSTTITGSVAVTGTFWQATQPVSLASTTITGNVTVVQPTGTNLHVVTDSGTITTVSTVTAVTAITNALPTGANTIGKVDILGNAGGILDTAKGTQSATAVGVQELKDAGRNMTNYFMAVPIITTTAEVMQSLTGYKAGAAVVATATPAVVTAGKTYRIQSVEITYWAATVIGGARVNLRANLSGVGVVGSPLVKSWQVGIPAIFTAGSSMTYTFNYPDGLEFAAGTGIAIGVIGEGAVPTTGTITGFVLVAIHGYEY